MNNSKFFSKSDHDPDQPTASDDQNSRRPDGVKNAPRDKPPKLTKLKGT